MATITLKYDARNNIVKKAIQEWIQQGVVEIENSPYNKEFVGKIKASEKQIKEGKCKSIITEDLWK